MGFTPRYLADLRNPAARATFVYAISSILLTEQHSGLSTAVKNLACYILARSAENHTLTAHAAFLAHRFGMRDRQLAACTDIGFLNALNARYRRRKREDGTASSSSADSSSRDSVDSAPPPEPIRRVESAKKRRRTRTELVDQLGGGSFKSERRNPFASVLASAPRLKKSLSFRRKKSDDSSRFQLGLEEVELEAEEDIVEEPPTMSDVLSSGDASFGLGLFRSKRGVPGISLDDEDNEMKEDQVGGDNGADCNDGSSESSDEITVQQRQFEFANSEPSFCDFGDNPEVPEVNGLNAMKDADEGDYAFDDGDDDYAMFDHFDDIVEVNEEIEYFEEESVRNGFGESIFTAKEVAVLLLAHDVARASKRNSLRAAKCPDAASCALLTPARAAQIQEMFKPDAIMEIISVVAVFNMLQRWTVCYPYRPGSLEAPVRKFVQTPIAHDLSVGSVGQRSASKSSVSLRTQHGRSIRLPRHAVVNL